MSFKRSIQLVVWPVVISLAAIIAASILDILLSALLPRFSSLGLTITCFAVSGIFSGLFCYSAALQPTETEEEKERLVMRTVLYITALCAVLFFVVAPFSGSEYNIPFKALAVAELLMVLFLWKNKFHQDM